MSEARQKDKWVLDVSKIFYSLSTALSHMRNPNLAVFLLETIHTMNALNKNDLQHQTRVIGEENLTSPSPSPSLAIKNIVINLSLSKPAVCLCNAGEFGKTQRKSKHSQQSSSSLLIIVNVVNFHAEIL